MEQRSPGMQNLSRRKSYKKSFHNFFPLLQVSWCWCPASTRVVMVLTVVPLSPYSNKPSLNYNDDMFPVLKDTSKMMEMVFCNVNISITDISRRKATSNIVFVMESKGQTESCGICCLKIFQKRREKLL